MSFQYRRKSKRLTKGGDDADASDQPEDHGAEVAPGTGSGRSPRAAAAMSPRRSPRRRSPRASTVKKRGRKEAQNTDVVGDDEGSFDDVDNDTSSTVPGEGSPVKKARSPKAAHTPASSCNAFDRVTGPIIARLDEHCASLKEESEDVKPYIAELVPELVSMFHALVQQHGPRNAGAAVSASPNKAAAAAAAAAADTTSLESTSSATTQGAGASVREEWEHAVASAMKHVERLPHVLASAVTAADSRTDVGGPDPDAWASAKGLAHEWNTKALHGDVLSVEHKRLALDVSRMSVITPSMKHFALRVQQQVQELVDGYRAVRFDAVQLKKDARDVVEEFFGSVDEE